MPRISEFFGIAIFMYWFDTQKHKLPHFHARKGGQEAVFNFHGDLIEGSLGSRAHGLIKEWCSERENELNQAWQHAIIGKEIPWVLPIH